MSKGGVKVSLISTVDPSELDVVMAAKTSLVLGEDRRVMLTWKYISSCQNG